MRHRIGLIIFALMIIAPVLLEPIYRLINGKLALTDLIGPAVLVLLVLAGFAIGKAKKHPQPPRRWLAGIVFVLVVGGIFYLLASTGDARMQFLVGLIAMVGGLVFWFVLVGFGVGSAFRRSDGEDKRAE